VGTRYVVVVSRQWYVVVVSRQWYVVVVSRQWYVVHAIQVSTIDEGSDYHVHCHRGGFSSDIIECLCTVVSSYKRGSLVHKT
jgi:hypothetical protein